MCAFLREQTFLASWIILPASALLSELQLQIQKLYLVIRGQLVHEI